MFAKEDWSAKTRRRKPEKVHFCAGKSVICKSGGLCVDESEATKKSEINTKIWKFRPTWPINFQRNGSLFISIGCAGDSALSRHLLLNCQATCNCDIDCVIDTIICSTLPPITFTNYKFISDEWHLSHTDTHTRIACPCTIVQRESSAARNNKQTRPENK